MSSAGKLEIPVGSLDLVAKGGDETPDTGTPPPRSASPSSDRSASSSTAAPSGCSGEDTSSVAVDGSECLADEAPQHGAKGAKSKRRVAEDAGPFSDKTIVEALAAPKEMHEMLVSTAHIVQEVLGKTFVEKGPSEAADASDIGANHSALANVEGEEEPAQEADASNDANSVAVGEEKSGDQATIPRRIALYGSLSYDVDKMVASEAFEAQDARLEDFQEVNPEDQAPQDWNTYYVTKNSDVDLVVLLESGATPAEVVKEILSTGKWRNVNATHVPKFATTQFTLLGSPSAEQLARYREKRRKEQDGSASSAEASSEKDDSPEKPEITEVRLDLTCIDSPLHFIRFKERQDAFQRSFSLARKRMERRYGTSGALAFDAYVHLLKAFAAQVPQNGLTGFQATCLGLFTLQLGLYEFMHTPPTALVLFECFLRFCVTFYGDLGPTHWAYMRGYKMCALDIAYGGRLLPRCAAQWRSEMYFMDAEGRLQTRPPEKMNIAHSLVPNAVHARAKEALAQCFTKESDEEKRKKNTPTDHSARSRAAWSIMAEQFLH